IQVHGSRKIRRVGVEADGHKILLTSGEQSINDRIELVGPFLTRRKHHRAGARDHPFTMIGTQVLWLLPTPAMVENVEAESRRGAQISLKRQSLLLLLPPTQDPLDGKGPGQEANRYLGMIEPTGGKLKAGLKQGTAQPAELYNAPLAATSHLQAAQNSGAFASVIAREAEVPDT